MRELTTLILVAVMFFYIGASIGKAIDTEHKMQDKITKQYITPKPIGGNAYGEPRN